jgi:hypothetical protein
MLRRPAVATLALCVALLAASACDGDSGGDEASPTPATPAATAVTTPTDPDAIRSLDLERTTDVQVLLQQTGGTYTQANVLYADLTDDGAEEAVVPVSSGGTLGDIAFIVLTPGGDSARALLMVVPAGANGVAVSIEGGKLVATEPVPGPDDPECCPSQIRTTVYVWDGSALNVESSVTGPNPGGGVKQTPTP